MILENKSSKKHEQRGSRELSQSIGHLQSPFSVLEVSGCDRPMAHGRAGSSPSHVIAARFSQSH